MTIWKVCVLFWVLLEVTFELCKMYLIFFFFWRLYWLPPLWNKWSQNQFTNLVTVFICFMTAFFLVSFLGLPSFFLFFSSFLSFPVSLTMSWAASLWKRWTYLISVLQAVCVEEVPWGILGEQDCFLVRGNFVHMPVATTCSSFHPVSRDL